MLSEKYQNGSLYSLESDSTFFAWLNRMPSSLFFGLDDAFSLSLFHVMYFRFFSKPTDLVRLSSIP